MDLWFSEPHADDVKLSFKVVRQLYSGESGYQRIDVFETVEFGRLLVIDGYVMLTEKDEFIYHEMLTHVPMAVHPNVESVLIIGAGDGGIVRELSRYGSVKAIELVEIDELVVKVSKEFFPGVACCFDDERLTVFHEDGLDFVKKREGKYDLVIVDSTDPIGPGESLFTKEFYENCHRALKGGGIMVNQHESAFYSGDALAMRQMHKSIHRTFEISRIYQAHIPTYASGHWLLGFASKRYHPVRDLNADAWNRLGIATRYYNTNLHRGAFFLPNYVQAMLEEVEGLE